MKLLILTLLLVSCGSKSTEFTMLKVGSFKVLTSISESKEIFIENQAGQRVRVYKYLFSSDKSLCCYHGLGEIVVLGSSSVLARKQEVVLNGISLLPTQYTLSWRGNEGLNMVIKGLDQRFWKIKP